MNTLLSTMDTSNSIFSSINGDFLFIYREYASEDYQNAYIIFLVSGSFKEKLRKLLSLRKRIPSISFSLDPAHLLLKDMTQNSYPVYSSNNTLPDQFIFVNKEETSILTVFPKYGKVNVNIVSKDIQVNIFPKSIFQIIIAAFRKEPVPVFKYFLVDSKASSFFKVITSFFSSSYRARTNT